MYGIIELINFAHGEIYMLGAFTALLVAGVLGIVGFPAGGILIVAALAAVVWSAAYGYTLEKVAYKPLRGAPRLSPLISAIGMSIFLQNYVLLAQTSDYVPFPRLLPDMEFLDYLGNIMGPSDFLILVTSTLAMVSQSQIIRYTRKGKAMRATPQNRNIALTREQLITNVWGYDFYGDDRTLDTHIKLLRRSLGPYSKFIVTLRGVGYRFETP